MEILNPMPVGNVDLTYISFPQGMPVSYQITFRFHTDTNYHESHVVIWVYGLNWTKS